MDYIFSSQLPASTKYCGGGETLLNITNLGNLKPSISSSVTCSYTTGKWEDFQTMQNMILFMLSAVFARECLVCGGGGGGGGDWWWYGVYLPRYQL